MSRYTVIEQITSFTQLNTPIDFCIIDKQACYAWIDETLRKFNHHRLKKRREKLIVGTYIRKVTGLSKIQVKRLIRKHKRRGELKLLLLVTETLRFANSRVRHSNDNALAESKNGSIVRKLDGHRHIPQAWTPLI